MTRFNTQKANSANSKLMTFYFFMSSENRFDSSCKPSPWETVCIKWWNPIFLENEEEIFAEFFTQNVISERTKHDLFLLLYCCCYFSICKSNQIHSKEDLNEIRLLKKKKKISKIIPIQESKCQRIVVNGTSINMQEFVFNFFNGKGIDIGTKPSYKHILHYFSM